tara:strand:- start:425 stop:1735 length:1311 start_codon:yes stop_codon:yes gene_type:complete
MINTIFKLNGYDINHAIQKYNNILNKNDDDFMFWKNEQKWKIAHYHFENNQLYKDKVVNNFPKKWEELPILTKKDFQSDKDYLVSKHYQNKNIYTSSTSGYSGTPILIYKNKFAHSMTWANVLYHYNNYELKLRSKQARFYGIPLSQHKFYYEKLKDLLFNRDRFSIFDLSDDKMELFLNLFKNKKYTYIYGYANSLYTFSQFLLNKGIILNHLCPSLKCCISTSEMLNPKMRKAMKQAFGPNVNIINEYGASELGIIAFEYDNQLLISEQNIFVEVDYSNDAFGKILVTDLFNQAMPIIRYDIGDLGSLSTIFYKGRERKVLSTLMGRTNDLIKLKNGRRIAGFTFYYVLLAVFDQFEIKNEIKNFMIRQIDYDFFIIDIVAADHLTLEKEKKIIQIAQNYLNDLTIKIDFNYSDNPYYETSGKMKHFQSELNLE